MINHLRTVLLNVSGSNLPPDNYPGEEYVPPTYYARVLRGGVAQAYQLLFGSMPDRALLNLRLRELLSIIHSTELAIYATNLDSRITYLPWDTSVFDQL